MEISPSLKNKVFVEWSDSALMKSPLPKEEENIVSKLLSYLPSQWEVKIKKNIPLGAGLGGGSSNAGSLLKFFVETKVLDKEEAKRIAVKLGADVPFFIEALPSWVTGIGENCSPLKIEKKIWETFSVLLVLVPEHCDTKKIFTHYKMNQTPFSLPTCCPEDRKQLEHYIPNAKNDLEETAASLFLSIRDALIMLRNTPHEFSGLSGSGSTCFALYSSKEECEKNVKELSNSLRKIGCKTVIAKILHVV